MCDWVCECICYLRIANELSIRSYPDIRRAYRNPNRICNVLWVCNLYSLCISGQRNRTRNTLKLCILYMNSELLFPLHDVYICLCVYSITIWEPSKGEKWVEVVNNGLWVSVRVCEWDSARTQRDSKNFRATHLHTHSQTAISVFLVWVIAINTPPLALCKCVGYARQTKTHSQPNAVSAWVLYGVVCVKYAWPCLSGRQTIDGHVFCFLT